MRSTAKSISNHPAEQVASQIRYQDICDEVITWLELDMLNRPQTDLFLREAAMGTSNILKPTDLLCKGLKSKIIESCAKYYIDKVENQKGTTTPEFRMQLRDHLLDMDSDLFSNFIEDLAWDGRAQHLTILGSYMKALVSVPFVFPMLLGAFYIGMRLPAQLLPVSLFAVIIGSIIHLIRTRWMKSEDVRIKSELLVYLRKFYVPNNIKKACGLLQGQLNSFAADDNQRQQPSSVTNRNFSFVA